MSREDNLDTKVAEAQGWEAWHGTYWDVPGKEDGDMTYHINDYHPSTDMAQAMELLIKYKIDINWDLDGITATFWSKDGSAILGRGFNEKSPMIAICKAFILASLDQQDNQ